MSKAGIGLLRRTVGLSLLSCAAVIAAPAYLSATQYESSTTVQELSLKEYESELDRCSEALKHPDDIPQLRGSLPASWTVRTGKTTVEVSTAPIASKLRDIETHPQNAAQETQDLKLQLNTMRNAASEIERGSQSGDDGASQKRLEKILARREFQKSTGPSKQELFQERINRWIAEHFLRLFRFLHVSEKTGNALAWIVMGLAFAALCYVVWKLLVGKMGNVRNTGDEEKPKLVSDAREWVREAFAAAERGDYREAIHCAYWAAVAKLEDLKVLSRDRTRTPRESLRLLEQHPSEQRMLRDMTGRFELIWYGYRPASAEDWAGAKEQLEKMGCQGASTEPTANS